MTNKNNSLTAIKGVSVGQSTHLENSQGVTLVVFDKPCPIACKTSGGTARTYDTSDLEDGKSSYLRQGIFIADGAFKGFTCAPWIFKGLKENKISDKIRQFNNPIISGAIINSFLWPMKVNFKPEYGYEAATNLSKEKVISGNVGVGTGATIGKFSWTNDWKCLAMKGGIGSARVDLGGGLMVCVLTVVNALGNVIDNDGSILAGNRNDQEEPKFRFFDNFSKHLIRGNTNTTISIVGTNAKVFSREDLRKIAEISGHGHIRAINPINTSIDGDAVFVFTTNEMEIPFTKLGENLGDEYGEWWKLKVDILGQAGAKAVQESIYDACLKAESVKYPWAYQGIIPSCKDYK